MSGHPGEVLHRDRLLQQGRAVLVALREATRQPHPEAAHEGNLAQTGDQLAEAVRRRIAEAHDPDHEPPLLVLSPHPFRRRDGIRRARVRPDDAAHVERRRLTLVIGERVDVGQ